MPDQPDLFTLPEPGRRKLALVAPRDAGMKTAIDHADAVIESWLANAADTVALDVKAMQDATQHARDVLGPNARLSGAGTASA